MEIKLFSTYLERLQKKLELFKPLVFNENLTVSLVLSGEIPLSINIRYDADEKQIWVDSPITYNLPTKLENLQDLMIKLFNDLIIREKKLGKLIATQDGSNLMFVKNLALDSKNLDLLADFIPQFMDEARLWRKKLKSVLKSTHPELETSPKEIVSFDYSLPN